MPHPIRLLSRLAARRRRRGSILILVVALVVLLALMGIAYLSSTQVERYTSAQHTINTEADLQMQGLVAAVDGSVVSGLYGSAPTGSAYRLPGQEMPTYDGTGTYDASGNALVPTPGSPAYPAAAGYNNYDAANTDLFLAGRTPVTSPSTGVPTWMSGIGWPLFPKSDGTYTFDSPYGPSINAYRPAGSGLLSGQALVGKGALDCEPAVYTAPDGSAQPGLNFYLPAAGKLQQSNGTVLAGAGYLTPSGALAPAATASTPIFAADADGDGIADAPLFQLPGGPIDGITYYGGYRVIDGNSAVNASTAWTSANDPAAASGGPALTNHGLFRTGVGLLEMFNPTSGYAATEMMYLNNYRFNWTATTPMPVVAVSLAPMTDSAPPAARSDFAWYSAGNAFDNQLSRRPGNAGYRDTGGDKYQWFGPAESAVLAHRFSLPDTSVSFSDLEQRLPYELLKGSGGTSYNGNVPTQPFDLSSAGAIANWYNGQFNFASGNSTSMPLRSVLTGNNAVSNAVAGRYGNIAAPPTWKPGITYNFGDWVTDYDGVKLRSYVCLIPHTSAIPYEPGAGTNAAAAPYWAGILTPAQVTAGNVGAGVPWTQQPVKTSINTAPFEQLWLGFCQVMTDSIGHDATVAGGPTVDFASGMQWQPPMRPVSSVTPIIAAPTELQMPMFSSVIRNVATPPTVRLTSSQMLKVRAALATVNAIDLRDPDNDVTSHRIILTNPDNSNLPAFDVEVFGTEAQPFIGSVYVHVDPAPANNFIAIQLVNPYDHPITISAAAGWKLGTVTRASFPALTMTDISAGLTTPFTIPARLAGQPGLAVMQSGTPPVGYTTPATSAALPVVTVTTLQQAIGSELYLMKPRKVAGTSAVAANAAQPYNESYDEAANISDLVPVDQVDLTTLAAKAGAATAADYYYRRGTDSTQMAGWNFVYPGPYAGPAAILPQGFGTVTSTAPSATNPQMAAYYGYSAGTATAADKTGVAQPTVPTLDTVPMVLNNTYMAGPNPLTGSTAPVVPAPPTFPFGGFTRNADMLNIPFVGAYRVRQLNPASGQPVTSPTTFVEMNSISEDSSLAEDTTIPAADPAKPHPGTDAVATVYTEQIGRFCPLGDTTMAETAGSTTARDFGNTTGASAYWHYHWARRLFEYFTVHVPSDDYTPDVDPTPGAYPGVNPPPVANSNPSVTNVLMANGTTSSEDQVGVEGLVNVNTAPAPVLAALPMLPTAAANYTLATAIVADRQANGPFKSIFDLYRVPAFRTTNDGLLATEPGPLQGLFSPLGIGPAAETAAVTGTGRPRYDYEERFLLLNRISNLITTRSDTFTAYVLLQGYRDVGVPGVTPTLVVQRRQAYLLDRNGVTPVNRQPSHYPVSTH